MAKEISSVIGQKSDRGTEELVAEGQEPLEFWELLGGKAPYANDKRCCRQTAVSISTAEPRLTCSRNILLSATGYSRQFWTTSPVCSNAPIKQDVSL